MQYGLPLIKSCVKNKTNYFQQLSLLEIEFDFNSKRNLHYFKDFESKYNLKTIHTNFKKMGVIIFLSEVLVILCKTSCFAIPTK